MRFSSLILSLTLSSLPFLSNAHGAPEVVTADTAPSLRPLGSERKHATGVITATIDGKKVEFTTTSEKIVISEERINAADERARETLRRMNGKMVDTASIKAIANALHITLDGYGNLQETGPITSGKEATSLKIAFALSPGDLTLVERQREISYAAPGVRTSDQAVSKDMDLKLETLTKLPNGALGLKGSFSATLTATRRRKPLPAPIRIEGTFDIQQANPDQSTLKLLEGLKK